MVDGVISAPIMEWCAPRRLTADLADDFLTSSRSPAALG